MITKDDNVCVFVSSNSISVNNDSVRLDEIKIPESLPEDFFYLYWWNNTDPKVYAYFTIENGDITKQKKHEFEPTEENFNAYVKLFVDQWQAEKERLIPEQALDEAKTERAEAVEKITVEVDGMVFDGDETAQTRMGRTIAAAVALGVDIETYTQVWVLADNTVANPTIKQLAQALKLAGEAQTALWTKLYE